MPGHDQTDTGLRRRRASARLPLALRLGVATIALGGGGRAWGQAPTAPTPAPASAAITATWQGEEAAPIRWTADRILTWQDDASTWFLLEDQARIEQGDVALASRQMVAQVIRWGRAEGPLYRINLYAEGQVCDPARPTTTFEVVRTELVTTGRYHFAARTPAGLHQLSAPPAGLPILARALAEPAAPLAGPEPSPAARPGAPAARRPVVPTQATRPAAAAGEAQATTTPEDPSSARPAAATTAPSSALAMPFGSTAPPAPVQNQAQTQASAARVDPAVVRTQQATGAGPAFPTGPGPGLGSGDDFTRLPQSNPSPTAPGSANDPSAGADGNSVPSVPPLDGGPPGLPTLPDTLPSDVVPLGPEGLPIGPGADDLSIAPPTNLLPLPDGTLRAEPGSPGPRTNSDNANIVVTPNSQRVLELQPRGNTKITSEGTQPDGTEIILIRNGVNIVTQSAQQGIIDLEADNIVIWIRNGDKEQPARQNINGGIVVRSTAAVEIYLEGHVVIRRDQLRIQGRADTQTFRAQRAFYDLQKETVLAHEAEVELYAPGLISPTKIQSPRILQFHPIIPGAVGPNGQTVRNNLASLQLDRSVTTGSRFANPGYRFKSREIFVDQVIDSQARPNETGLPYDQNDRTWQIDARQNFFFVGPVPAFYWPRLFVEADDINPPLQALTFASNNYFGQQIRSTFDVFNILGRRHVPEIDSWIFNLDYLSGRDKSPGQGIALGTDIGWFGQDLVNDIVDPFHKNKDAKPSAFGPYTGYFDSFALFDGSRDVLGFGPAIITNGSNNNAAGRLGGPGSFFSRLSNPTFQYFRGRVTARHMQSFNTLDTPLDEDTRVNFEFGLTSDRNFLEQYYKRLFDTGLDQENLIYGIRQWRDRALTIQAEVNLQQFYTDTQWLPKGDYYSLGNSLLGNRLTYYGHTGADYADVHTAAEVNNRTLFAYLPTDPISNTNRAFESGRLSTAHELDLPLNFGFLRVTPYLQGQAVGWNNQINDHAVGRLWGAGGARADVMLWKVYPDVESELFNLHGINHKIDFVADFRDAYSTANLNSLGVQDDLDDNTYEYARRYFALTNYGGGILPPQYDPRLLLIRRALSPITGPTDVQATVETLKLGIHQRLQTKRGQEGKRHINDYIAFDLDTTYFPNAARDNFNKPFGQNFYNFEWYLGDRTSFVSYGWFEFFKIGGDPTTINNNLLRNDPFGLHIVTSGISLTRVPKGNIFIGYTIVNTGPISTSALNTSYTYWLSPKWFGTAATSYDFGDDLLLSATGSLTRIGADYLTSVGLIVSPLQKSYMFQVEVSPRITPNLRAGSAAGLTRLDSRFAPVE